MTRFDILCVGAAYGLAAATGFCGAVRHPFVRPRVYDSAIVMVTSAMAFGLLSGTSSPALLDQLAKPPDAPVALDLMR
jgi:hypothetical protein